MTVDRNRPDVDTIVADTYRALSDEKVPEHLDRAVLDMAKNIPPRQKSFFAQWMKPVAWAATIGLCVAVVLELTELPNAKQNELLTPAVESLSDRFEVRDVEIIKKAERQLQLQQGKIAADDSLEIEEREQSESIEVPLLELKRGAESYAASAPSSAVSAEKAYAREPRIDQNRLLEETDDAIRREDSRCSAAARRSAGAWIACIENLRDSGDDHAADEERQALARQFPEELAKYEANK